MRPVLCVIDLSEASVHVLEIASQMARATYAPLVVLYPYRLILNGFQGEVSKLKFELEKNASEKFKEITSKVPALATVEVVFCPEIGFVYDRVAAKIKKENINSVVISEDHTHLINEANVYALQNLIASSHIPFTIVPKINPETVTAKNHLPIL